MPQPTVMVLIGKSNWIGSSMESNTEEGCYQIDACPRGFGVVLNWLRYRSLILSREVKAEDVLPVADYFRAPDLAGEAAGDGGGGAGEADNRHRGGRGEAGGGPTAHRGGVHRHQRQARGLQSGGRRVLLLSPCSELNCIPQQTNPH